MSALSLVRLRKDGSSARWKAANATKRGVSAPKLQSKSELTVVPPEMMEPKEILKVEVEMQACFSGESIRIEVMTGEKGSTLAIAHNKGDRATTGEAAPHSISASIARENIDRILAVLSRSPRLGDNRSTTLYTAEVTWQYGNSRSTWSYSTSELPAAAMRELLPQLDGDLRRKVESLLSDYYNPAHELMDLCRILATQPRD